MLLASVRKREACSRDYKTEEEEEDSYGKLGPSEAKKARIENCNNNEVQKAEDKKVKIANWLGTHRHLQAAFAAIDDRLLFFRLCEELDARSIRYEQVSAERTVGGHMIRLTDISLMASRHGMEHADFFQNLLHCNIRLAQPFPERSQLECTFINPPLVPDFDRSDEEVLADKNRAHTWVQPIGTSPPQSSRSRAKIDEMSKTDPPGPPLMSQVIAQNIEDRLLAYCQLYIPIRRFARAYSEHFSRFCNVCVFTYFKLSLAYGDHRELLLVLTWRGQRYSLCFGQAPRVEDGGRERRRWNPHVLVSQALTERFNRERDLVWLVNYLVNTHRSLGTIYNFMRTKMHSTKTAAQLLGTEASFPAELMSHLCALDESTIRLSYGPRLSMEFRLLGDNQVAVRDCSVGFSRNAASDAPSLADFWREWQKRTDSNAVIQ